MAGDHPFALFLQKLHLRQALTIKNILKIHKFHLCIKVPVTFKNAVHVYLSRLMSYDYRAPYTFSELSKTTVNSREESVVESNADPENWINVVLRNECQTGESLDPGGSEEISCRDGVFATILSSDPFVLQEIISKMAACQLAVPLLLPNPATNEVIMLHWGLRQIKRSWAEDSGEVHEVRVTEDCFPTISFLRLGSISVSKSTIINLMLGSVQGKDDHPFFFSSKQDIIEPDFTRGMLEGFWFQPNDGRPTSDSFISATCFLNLRGDATEFLTQQTFACKFAPLVVVFVNSSNLKDYEEEIDNIKQTTKVILVALMGEHCRPTVRKFPHFTVCNVSTKNDKVIAKTLCSLLCNKLKENIKESRLASDGLKLSQSLGIRIDSFSQVCSTARKNAVKILNGVEQSPMDYKASVLQLQQSWRKWTEIDKDRSWQASDRNIEDLRAQRELAKRELRRTQLKLGVSQPIKLLHETLLKATDVKMQFVTLWLQILLNENSQSTLSDLIKNIQILGREFSNKKREITSTNREIEQNENLSIEEKKDKANYVRELEAEEKQLKLQRLEAAEEFDKASVGFEHLLREIGQWFESQCESKKCNLENGCHLPQNNLPKLVAKLLLLGQPIEIVDGDACHVPILWVKGLLKEVQSQITPNAKLFIISVLGIQSSGKSTLLNSMFGVRFAVSAGRCTRGVYMQMLEVEKSLRKELGCDFLVIIDTEGLRAPEKNIAGTPHFDNELATFSLCLSNLTLINIGGQTVGDDLTDILQVAAHAFIRMKQVQLQSSCRLVQQFVADLTARAKNENSTQSIKQKLDEATKTAAKEEGMHRRYSQFTDVFNILNDDDMRDLQYIPSLWRGSTAPPNQGYSEKVLELKASVLKGIKNSAASFLNISQFGQRIEDVWNAVKQEDFVFNFKNSIIMAQYKNFQELYQRLKIDIRKETMSIELQRKDEIAKAAAERIEEVLSKAQLDLCYFINEKHDTAKKQLVGILENNSFSEVKRLYKHQFITDLHFFKGASLSQMETKLNAAAQKARKKKLTEDTHLPNLRAGLRKRVLSVAEDLRASYSSHLKVGKSIPEYEIKGQFNEVWKTSIENIQRSCSPPSDTEVREQINGIIRRCLQNVHDNNFSKFLKVEIQNKDNYHTFSKNACNIYDMEHVTKLMNYLEKDDTTLIDPVYERVIKIVRKDRPKLQTCSCDDLLTHNTLQPLLIQLKEFLDRNISLEMNDIQWHLTCIAGFTISILQEEWRDNFVKFSPEFLEHLESSSVSNSWDTIHKNVTKILFERSTGSALTTAWRYTKGVLDLVVPHRHTKIDYKSEINRLLEDLKYDHNSYESGSLVSDFIDTAVHIVKSNVESKDQNKVLTEIGLQLTDSIYHKRKRSQVDLKLMEEQYPQYAEGCDEIKIAILTVLKDVCSAQNVKILEADLSPDTIQKIAYMPQNITLQRAIDINILCKLEKHHTFDYCKILTEIRDIKRKFLIDITKSGFVDDALISALINDTQRRFPQYLETDEGANLILHMCAWALPFCAAVQISYEKKHNLVLQIEETKEKYYEDFKNWCLDSANDTRQAEELHELLKPGMLACVENKICPTLYGLLADEGEIFRSRQHLIKHILLDLADAEDFQKYFMYIKDHNMFTKTWISNYVASMCAKRTPKLDISTLASTKIRHVVNVTRLCFIESLPNNKDLSPEEFLDTFLEKCKNKCSIHVDENGFDTLKKFSSTIKDYETYKNEFLKLLEKLPVKLLHNLNIPNEGDIDSTSRWLQKLPEQLDIELGKRVEGCHNQCPFCGSVCDETLDTHKIHVATLHYPCGIKGIRNKSSKELSCEVCTSKVATDRRYYPHCRCDKVECDCEWFYYKEYDKKYPDWHIRPIPDTEPTSYWKWVIAKFNTDFAKNHNAKIAKVPTIWNGITKDEAMASLSVFSVGSGLG